MTQSIGSSTTPTTTPSIIQTTVGAGSQSIGGLATGLDTNSIINALVAAERAQENPIKAQADSANLALQAYAAIRTDMSAFSTAALALARPSGWNVLTASSSNENVATVATGSGSFGGSLAFTVDQLAAAGSVRSANTVTGTASTIAAHSSVYVASKGATVGFASFLADDNLALGAHTINVTQASAAAVKSGDSALGGLTVVDGTNDTLTLTVNGTPTTLTMAHGTFTAAQLAQAVQDAADTAGSPIKASVKNTGELELTTTREGSQADIQITGGNALMALQMSTDGAAITGTDGVLNVDGGGNQTFTSLDAGSAITLNAAVGTITATLSGGLRTGSVSGTNVSTGDGSLATVVGAINSAAQGVTATAVLVGNNTYRLQITSNTAGALNGENVDAGAFNANVGGLTTLTAAADASLTVGSGPGAYSITSSTNTVSGLLPGVTVTLKAKSTDPVTITVARDENALADKVQAMVDAANNAKKDIDGLTSYDPNTKTASVLTGDTTTTRLMTSLTNAFINVVSSANPKSPGLAGVSVDKSGNFTFDRSKFLSAYEADPAGVQKLFAQGGTAESSDVTFVSAGDGAVAGSYDVNITQVALQATNTGLTDWPPVGSPTVQVRVGSTVVSYAVGGGDTRADVAAGLNAAFASNGLALQATDTGSGVKISTIDYGHTAKFDVDWGDGNGYTSNTGQDVAGTINGIAATGSGQQLLVPFSDKTIGGLALKITATNAGDLGNFTYDPGIAARTQTATVGATDLITGYITSTENELKARIKFVNDEVASMEQRVNAYETMVRQQFAQLEATIGTLKTQSDWLSNQVAQDNKSGK
ncbi:MAG TPA: flagellar filament capping protein FliD [Acidimicrobiia bacterium]|nr:flagellar filament capping protein FliD [Acidimicrobiia bacterium]